MHAAVKHRAKSWFFLLGLGFWSKKQTTQWRKWWKTLSTGYWASHGDEQQNQERAGIQCWYYFKIMVDRAIWLTQVTKATVFMCAKTSGRGNEGNSRKAWLSCRMSYKSSKKREMIHLERSVWSPELVLVLMSLIKFEFPHYLSFSCRKEEEIVFCFSSFFPTHLFWGGLYMATQVAGL